MPGGSESFSLSHAGPSRGETNKPGLSLGKTKKQSSMPVLVSSSESDTEPVQNRKIDWCDAIDTDSESEDGINIIESPITNDHSVNQIDGEWEEIELTVDSGASMSMAPEWFCVDYKLQPTNESINKVAYKAAIGTKIVELGKRTPLFQFENGSIKCIEFRIGPVHKTFLSTKKICAQGFRVVLDDDGSYIQHKKTEEIIPIHPKGNLYVLRVKKVPGELAPVFHRPARKL